MKRAADVLYLLSTFSLRTRLIEKAAIYASAGYRLFPEDTRLIEMHAYALLLQRKFEEAEEVLANTTASTPNLEFLRSRAAILLGLDPEEQRLRLRRYLGTA
ncbi:MAG: hypothetical protein MUE98_00945 [Rhodobacteraceae bacterium]|jgi:hypothetical protein|nr:hypothetical protein [Paracoccaceae bacterium]